MNNDKIKNRVMISVIYVIIGAFIAVMSIFTSFEAFQSGILTGFGAAFICVGIVRLVRYHRLSRDPEKAAEWENMQHEERTIFIAEKACRWTFYISIFVELVIALVAIFAFDNKVVGQVIMYLCCAQCLTYVVIYKVLERKY